MTVAVSLADVLSDPPKPHSQAMGLMPDALQFIYDHASKSCTTLETGCGISTVIYALRESVHTVICPARDEFKIVTDYCLARQIPTGRVTFIESASERALPSLQLAALDMVLIDGRHGFPA